MSNHINNNCNDSEGHAIIVSQVQDDGGLIYESAWNENPSFVKKWVGDEFEYLNFCPQCGIKLKEGKVVK